jgi:hypothetical protein
MQDEFVVQGQLSRIEDGLPCFQNLEVLRDAPKLMVGATFAIFAGNVAVTSTAIEVSLRSSGCHGRSFPSHSVGGVSTRVETTKRPGARNGLHQDRRRRDCLGFARIAIERRKPGVENLAQGTADVWLASFLGNDSRKKVGAKNRQSQGLAVGESLLI